MGEGSSCLCVADISSRAVGCRGASGSLAGLAAALWFFACGPYPPPSPWVGPCCCLLPLGIVTVIFCDALISCCWVAPSFRNGSPASCSTSLYGCVSMVEFTCQPREDCSFACVAASWQRSNHAWLTYIPLSANNAVVPRQ